MIFKRVVEDFTCEKCGAHVEGSGYTNHCPKCLWSKHVDVNPGDRAASCGGMMEPARIEGSSPDYSLVHHCSVCGFEKRNKLSPEDDMDEVLRLAGLQKRT